MLEKKNKDLVTQIVKKLFKKHYPGAATDPSMQTDLKEVMFQDGVIGFLDAKKKYKKETGVPFGAYAAIRIRGAIIDAMRKSPQVRLPQNQHAKVKRLLEAKNQLVEQGKTPSVENLVECLNWQADKVLEAEKLRVEMASSDENPLLTEVGLRNTSQNQENDVLKKELTQVMQRCIDGLDDASEKLILVARNIKKMKLRQLAEKFNCSIEKIRQKELRAKTQMQTCLKAHGWGFTQRD